MMRALRPTLLALPLVAMLSACSESSSGGASTAGDPDGGAEAAPPGHSVRLDVHLTPDDGGETVSFLTPAVSVFTMPVADVVGKPYYVAVFAGGFDQGVDLDLHHAWGTIP